jgi:AraC family transcriptional activator of pobA
MYKYATDAVIPEYAFEDYESRGNNMFNIREMVVGCAPLSKDFLIPHRKNYYLLVFVKQGDSKHWIDMVPYTLKPNCFYFSIPRQVHLKEEQRPVKGIALTFTKEFLALEDNDHIRRLPIIENRFDGHELKLDAADIAFTEDILQKILAEYNSHNDWQNSMLLAYLRVLLIYLSRIYNKTFDTDGVINKRDMLTRFQTEIETNYKQRHEVAAYAGELNVSAGYLSELVKQQSGKSAIEHIHERLLLEARRLLFHTELSVKEIAFELGFEDASYFNRFFKRLAADTPMAYRTDIRKMYHNNP